jgi:hypothetical protein
VADDGSHGQHARAQRGELAAEKDAAEIETDRSTDVALPARRRMPAAGGGTPRMECPDPRSSSMTLLDTRPIDVTRLDITRTNIAVQRLIERTENPRHRYILQAYDRHRNLEHAGRFEEIFEPQMTVEQPVYRFNMFGGPTMTLNGRDQVEPLYRHWSETNQTIFYNEDEQVAIGDSWW